MTIPTGTPLRAATVTAAAACALLLASCSSGTGQPQSQDTSTAETSSTPLADLAPCSSLTEQQKKQLGITEPGEINKYKDSTCDWEIDGNKFGISIYEDMALENIGFSDSEEKKEAQVNENKALLVKNNTGSSTCSLAFAVTENSSVSVNGTAAKPGDTATACELVQKAAPMVEKNIPES